MSLKDTLSTYWLRLQGELLPWLDDTMGGPLSGHHKQLVSVLGLLRIETLLPSGHGLIGRPSCQRAALARAKRKRGRPCKGQTHPSEPPRRIERQLAMTVSAMLEDLPQHCDGGTKHNAKGNLVSWIGYKLHIDSADGAIPISCVLTAA